VVWLAMGAAVYGAYGYWHSKLRDKSVGIPGSQQNALERP
jgi:hypothetical protein